MVQLSLLISILLCCWVSSSIAQQCDESSHDARFDCYPESEPTKEKCLTRNCCWRILDETISKNNLTGVPFCYYPKDFPTYEVISNNPTEFGQRIQIVKSQKTYMPNDIFNLTVDLIYETQQRLRIKIYDPNNKRYEVPLDVPIVQTKVNDIDYNISINAKPFALIVTRKSTGALLYVLFFSIEKLSFLYCLCLDLIRVCHL